MKAGARALPAAALIFGLILGCKGSLNAEANASSSGDANASASGELDAEGKGEMSRSSDIAGPGIADLQSSSRVLLGARHDLKLQPGKGTASCQCLSVALGGSRNAAMLWSAAPPSIDESTQLTIALSSDGVDCKGEPKGSLGASYWGYRISGNDVVVFVESARGGHPLTSGAVIPRPVGGGQVYVQPASKKLPYGRPLDGKGMCKIGNPGQARATPFTELELGRDVPRPAATGTVGPGAAGGNDVPTTIDMSN